MKKLSLEMLTSDEVLQRSQMKKITVGMVGLVDINIQMGNRGAECQCLQHNKPIVKIMEEAGAVVAVNLTGGVLDIVDFYWG